MDGVTANWYILLQTNSAEYIFMLQGVPTVLQSAITRVNEMSLLVGIYRIYDSPDIMFVQYHQEL